MRPCKPENVRPCACPCGCRQAFSITDNKRLLRCLGCRAGKTGRCKIVRPNVMTDARKLASAKCRGGMNTEWIDAELDRLAKARRPLTRWTA